MNTDAIKEDGIAAIGVVAHLLIQIDASSQRKRYVAIKESVLHIQSNLPWIVFTIDALLFIYILRAMKDRKKMTRQKNGRRKGDFIRLFRTIKVF